MNGNRKKLTFHLERTSILLKANPRALKIDLYCQIFFDENLQVRLCDLFYAAFWRVFDLTSICRHDGIPFHAILGVRASPYPSGGWAYSQDRMDYEVA